MRARTTILREIAARNLDPKIPYVAGKNGQLKEKKSKKNDSVESASKEVTKPIASESIETTDYTVPDGAVRVRDSEKQAFEEASAEVESEQAQPKKKAPVKKKKT